MSTSKNISILGLGWLGLPLAKALHQSGHKVRGSVRSMDKLQRLKELSFDAHIIRLQEDGIQGEWEAFLHRTEILIINVPPGRTDNVEHTYPALMDQIIQQSSSSLKVIFTSTTGVYANENQRVNEHTAPNPSKASGKAVLNAEERLRAYFGDNLTIPRLAGLIGEERHPGRFLAAKKEVANGDSPVNLVHQKDCIGIIHQVIEKDVWGKIINVCASQHPTRKVYYQKAASALELGPPQFQNSATTDFKIVDNTYSKQLLDYGYQYDNPEDIFTKKHIKRP